MIYKIGAFIMGLFCFCGGYFRWGFFVNGHKFRRISNLLGEEGTRKFYMIFGIIIMILALIAKA